MMDRKFVLELLQQTIASFQAEDYLLQKKASERSITARLMYHLQTTLPAVAATNKVPCEELVVDCEYNRHGDDAKWVPWDYNIADPNSEELYYTPFPDIILHKRGLEGPNLLAIEVKIQGRPSALDNLLDKMKVVGYIRPQLKYRFGLYLVLRYGKPGIQVVNALLATSETINAMDHAKTKPLWENCKGLITKSVSECGRVSILRELSKADQALADDYHQQIESTFGFEEIKTSLQP